MEPTSGNQGIGIALVGAVKGYQVKIIMPDSVSEERRKLVQQYGAEVVLIHDDGDIESALMSAFRPLLGWRERTPKFLSLSSLPTPTTHWFTSTIQLWRFWSR